MIDQYTNTLFDVKRTMSYLVMPVYGHNLYNDLCNRLKLPYWDHTLLLLLKEIGMFFESQILSGDFENNDEDLLIDVGILTNKIKDITKDITL